MLANAKQFVPPTNKTHSPRINAGEKKKTYRNGWREKREIRKIRVLRESPREMFVARGEADSWSRTWEELSQRAN